MERWEWAPVDAAAAIALCAMARPAEMADATELAADGGAEAVLKDVCDG